MFVGCCGDGGGEWGDMPEPHNLLLLLLLCCTVAAVAAAADVAHVVNAVLADRGRCSCSCSSLAMPFPFPLILDAVTLSLLLLLLLLLFKPLLHSMIFGFFIACFIYGPLDGAAHTQTLTHTNRTHVTQQKGQLCFYEPLGLY